MQATQQNDQTPRLTPYLLRALLWPRPSLAGLWALTLLLFLGAGTATLGTVWARSILAPSLYLGAVTGLTVLLIPFQTQLSQLASRKTLALDGRASAYLCIWGALLAALWALSFSALIAQPGDPWHDLASNASLLFAVISLLITLGTAWQLDAFLSLLGLLIAVYLWQPLVNLLQLPHAASSGYLPILLLLSLGLWWMLKRRIDLGQIDRPLSETLIEFLVRIDKRYFSRKSSK